MYPSRLFVESSDKAYKIFNIIHVIINDIS
jgi:hypothetical protein